MSTPTIRFTLPFPPSVNSMYAGKERRRKSDKYEDWCRRARAFTMAFKLDHPDFRTLNEPLAAWYRHGEFDDKRVRDVENYAKAISDLLKDEGIIKDDSLIRRTVGEWADDIRPEYTEVIILPLTRLVVSIA